MTLKQWNLLRDLRSIDKTTLEKCDKSNFLCKLGLEDLGQPFSFFQPE
jgi:hypothetical protein